MKTNLIEAKAALYTLSMEVQTDDGIDAIFYLRKFLEEVKQDRFIK